ncbi:uncharacterized protein [Littorina saxatilis]|uniref:Uncharacterized protein n=1 Tax=Littorina saxatilis TaxID=31220 RepID=A0AAN9G1X7_9CAEN
MNHLLTTLSLAFFALDGALSSKRDVVPCPATEEGIDAELDECAAMDDETSDDICGVYGEIIQCAETLLDRCESSPHVREHRDEINVALMSLKGVYYDYCL